MQTRIPCVLMRSGTSRGPFFLAADLPSDPATRDAVLLATMGSPHPLQVDGLGGGGTLTSKAARLLLGSGVTAAHHTTRAATRAPRRALPRRRALWTNSKKPR